MADFPVRRWLRRLLLSSALLPALPMACGPLSGPHHPGSPALLCGGKRWIGIKPGGFTCGSFLPASTPGWATAPLFAGSVPARLSRYCLYTWSPPAGPSASDVAALTASAGSLKGFAEDCPVVEPLAFPEVAAREQRRAIHDAAGGLASLPARPAPRATRLAVVDDAPDSLGPDGAGPADMQLLPSIRPHTGAAPFGEHGEVLASLGRDLGCPEGEGGPCAVHVETALALRDGGSQAPDTIGGLSGTKGDLAVAVRRTVSDWKDDLAKGGEPRLVINLSVGWEDHPDEANCHVADPTSLEAPAQAVYDVLLQARCHGALLVAAAGNDTGSGSSGGLVCPAHFAQWKVPECAGDLVDPDFERQYAEQTKLRLRPSTGAYDPLLHPVGAVDFGDAPLAPHRPGSLPRLVAPGFLGVSYEGYFGPAQAGATLPAVAPYPLTGTSVSALLVSAAASTAWAYVPDRAPADIVAAIYDQGAVMSYAAEAAPLTTPSTVHRASLCRALRGLGLLPATTPCSDPDPGRAPDQNARLSVPLAAAMSAYYASGGSAAVAATSVPTTPLARFPTEAAGLDVSPQPIWPGCPSCGIEPTIEPLLHIDPPANVRFTNAHLVVGIQGTFQSYALGNLSGRTSLRLSRNVSIAPGSRVYLVWEEGSGTSAYAQLPVW